MPLSILALLLTVAEPNHLHAFVGGGYLTTPGGQGAAVVGGMRYSIGRHFAVSLAASYGSLNSIQDRWWVMPTIAWVIPAGAFRFDFGAGVGSSTATAFASWSDYSRDQPMWVNEAVPSFRLNAIVAAPISPGFELFARADATMQLLEQTSLGWRRGEAPTRNTGTMFLNLSVGCQFRLF